MLENTRRRVGIHTECTEKSCTLRIYCPTIPLLQSSYIKIALYSTVQSTWLITSFPQMIFECWLKVLEKMSRNAMATSTYDKDIHYDLQLLPNNSLSGMLLNMSRKLSNLHHDFALQRPSMLTPSTGNTFFQSTTPVPAAVLATLSDTDCLFVWIWRPKYKIVSQIACKSKAVLQPQV